MDIDIATRVNELSEEEEHLYERAGDGRGLGAEDIERLQAIKVELDRCYALLHQREARRALGSTRPTHRRDRPTSWSTTNSDDLGGSGSSEEPSLSRRDRSGTRGLV